MLDANVGQSLTQSGMVVVSTDVWKVCSRDRFFANILENDKFVEVVQVSMCMHLLYTFQFIHTLHISRSVNI